MNTIHPSRIKVLCLVFALSLLLVGCKGVGIFAYIATTEKIDEGLLPSGLGTSKILQINDEYGEPNYYNYISSHSAFYRRNTQDRSNSSTNRWETVSLPSGWTNIQSIAASDKYIIMALGKVSNSVLEMGIFYYNNTEGFSEKVSVTDDILISSSDSYKTIQIYCPNPAAASNVFYVNILSFSGEFAQDSDFSGSKLYTLDNKQETLSNANLTPGADWSTILEKSWVSSAVHSGGLYRFTTVNPTDQTGTLTDETGKQIDNTPTIPLGNLTWLPNLGTNGLFIMSSMMSGNANNSYPIYVSNNENGNEWTKISSAYRFACFLDVSETVAGTSDKIILAGTISHGIKNATGYLEIVSKEANPQDWTIRTNKNDFTFAQTGTYIASALSTTSVTSLTLLLDNNTNRDPYVYASTGTKGIWRINANNSDSKWAGE